MIHLNKIGGINIPNKYTFLNLSEVFKNKKPTNKTILLLRLYAEKHISAQEMLTLKEEDVIVTKTGKDLINNQNHSKDIYLKIQNFDKYGIQRKNIIEKIGL